MKNDDQSTMQSFMREMNMALSVNLPEVLRGLGYELVEDSSRGWRIPGNGGLIIWKRDDGIWGWNHFSTGDFGDSISFFTDFHGISRKQSVHVLARALGSSTGNVENIKKAKLPSSRSKSHRLTIKEKKAPTQAWREKAIELVELSRNNLHRNKNQEVWQWLQARGLKQKTIKKAKLGWISEEYWQSLTTWGLPQEIKENGQRKKLWIPRGVTIPAFDMNENIMRIRIRRFSEEKPKYYTFPGSCMNPLIIGPIKKPVIICESDLDAWLIHQQAGNEITSVSLGFAGAKPDTMLVIYLITAPKILISLDADEAGKKSSQWWIDRFTHAKYWPVPWGKDPGDSFGEIPDIIEKWIKAGLG